MRLDSIGNNPIQNYLIVAVTLWIFMFWASFNHQSPIMNFGGDFWEHAAALKAWMTNLSNPASPHVSSAEGSSRYMPFFYLIAALGQLFDLTSLQAMGLASIISFSLLLIGIPYFSVQYFKDNRAPLFTIVVLLCGWGFAWNWSNAYQFRNLLSISAYPSFFVFAFSFFIFGLIIRHLDGKMPRKAIVLPLIALLIAIAFSSHPLTGVYSVFFSGLLALFYGQAQVKIRALVVIAILTGSLLVELWPYFSTWAVILGKTPDRSVSWITNAVSTAEITQDIPRWKKLIWGHPFYSPLQLAASVFPVVIGGLFLFFTKNLQKYYELKIASVLMLLVYALNMFTTIPLGHRALLLGMLPLHLLLVGGLLNLYKEDIFILGYSTKKLVTVYLGSISLMSVVLVGFEIYGYRLQPNLRHTDVSFSQDLSVISKYQPIANNLDESSIVMVDALHGWALPSLNAKVVSGMHANPLISDRMQRSRDVRAFFKSQTTESEKDLLLKKYHVTHILIKNDIDEAEKYISRGGFKEIGEFTLIKLTG
jgi:hypothetical protein